MDETTPAVKPTFLEKLKANKKQLITIVVSVLATAAGIALISAASKPADEDDSDFALALVEAEKLDNPDSIAA